MSAISRIIPVNFLCLVEQLSIAVMTLCHTLIKRYQWLTMKQKTRVQLKDLSSEQLDDIGITHEQALAEMKKTFGE